MNQNHKEFLSITLTLSIIAAAVFIIHKFIPSLVWASIIVISTYPLYKRWRGYFRGHDGVAAFLFTTILSLLLILPLSWLVGILVKDAQLLINYLQLLNKEGGEAPDLISNFPKFGADFAAFWNTHIAEPGSVKELLSNIHISLAPASFYIKMVGMSLVRRGFQLGFTLLTLFFFFRDGDKLFAQIHYFGERCLGARWFKYVDKLPSALRSTVNGTIVVGLGVGVLMGICYGLFGFPTPTLMGFITAFAAMIPFVVPLVFMVVAFTLYASGSVLGAIVVLVWGTIVMFVADHFIKPVLIGGAIQLPFLAVLFGILGGVETLGILGLFVGPIIMVLFLTLWQESQT